MLLSWLTDSEVHFLFFLHNHSRVCVSCNRKWCKNTRKMLFKIKSEVWKLNYGNLKMQRTLI